MKNANNKKYQVGYLLLIHVVEARGLRILPPDQFELRKEALASAFTEDEDGPTVTVIETFLERLYKETIRFASSETHGVNLHYDDLSLVYPVAYELFLHLCGDYDLDNDFSLREVVADLWNKNGGKSVPTGISPQEFSEIFMNDLRRLERAKETVE